LRGWVFLKRNMADKFSHNFKLN